jgi:hypothetical protein
VGALLPAGGLAINYLLEHYNVFKSGKFTQSNIVGRLILSAIVPHVKLFLRILRDLEYEDFSSSGFLGRRQHDYSPNSGTKRAVAAPGAETNLPSDS